MAVREVGVERDRGVEEPLLRVEGLTKYFSQGKGLLASVVDQPTVKAVDDATLSAQSAGTVIALADLGDYVGRGAAVAQLDPQIPEAAVGQAEAAVEAARAQFDLAEDNYNRQTPLYRDSIISAIEYQNVRAQFSQARAQLNQAEAALSSAKKQLQNTYVRTPFAGVVEQQFVERGEQGGGCGDHAHGLILSSACRRRRRWRPAPSRRRASHR